MLTPGMFTTPVILIVVSPRQNAPDSEMGKLVAPGVIMCVALFHVQAKETPDAAILQSPKALEVIVKLPFVRSTAVVLVAVKVQGASTTTATAPRTLDVQLEKVGGAGVVPPVSAVKASAPPADRTPEWKVHVIVTPEGDRSNVSVPCAASVVFAGSQLAAEAEPAPSITTNITAAMSTGPGLFIMDMPSSWSMANAPTRTRPRH
jgi:hypothetical protein